jgi:CHAD domain-containing protein
MPGVLTGDDPHDVHQMRVATRRLRASLEATEAAYDPERVDSLRSRLRKLARALGEVRDRDVLLLRLREDAAKIAAAATMHAEADGAEQPPTDLQGAIDRLSKERNKAHGTLVGELSRKRTRRLLDELTSFLTAPLEEVEATQDARMPVLVRHDAGSALWREYEAVRRFETMMPTATSEQLHELRIAAKHLRYTMELFEPALGATAKDVIKQVEGLQEHLGRLHDTDVAIDYLTTTATRPGKKSGQAHASENGKAGMEQRVNVLDEYVAARRKERDALIAGALPLWQGLVDDETRHRVAAMIAGL